MVIEGCETEQEVIDRLEFDARALDRFVSSGDEDAFRELVACHAGWVAACCRRRLCDGELADDATQAVFILLAEHADDIRRDGCLSAWLQHTACCVAEHLRQDTPPTGV